ncbi:MAG: hypothetical protein IPP76_10550 [Moraxellaceae bacterium]|nr:hypothetical protein [Moraxellaceae bacterium]
MFDDAILMKSGEIYSVCGVCYNPIKQSSDLRRCAICNASLSYRAEANLIKAELLNKRYIADLNERKTNERKLNKSKYDADGFEKIKIMEGFIYKGLSTDNNFEPNVLEIIRLINGLKAEVLNIKEYISRLNAEIHSNFGAMFVDLIIVIIGWLTLAGTGNIYLAMPIMIGYVLIKLISYFVRRSKKAELIKTTKNSLVLANVLKRYEQVLVDKVTAFVTSRIKDLGVIELSKILIDLKVEKYKLRVKSILDSCDEFQAIALVESDDVLYRSLVQESGKNITTIYLDDDEDLRDDGSSQMA